MYAVPFFFNDKLDNKNEAHMYMYMRLHAYMQAMQSRQRAITAGAEESIRERSCHISECI